MGKLSGTVLILAGVSLAAYTLSSQYEGAARVTAAPGAVSTDARGTPPEARVAETRATQAAATEAGTAPSPATADPDATTAQAGPGAATASGALPTDAPVPAGVRRLRPASVVQIGEAPPRMPVGEPEAMAGPPLDRPALARQIQRQLKRIGCYGGQVTGAWTPSVRQAVTTLMERVNASLPIDQPDPVLLAMVESQSVGACSKACPAGQGRVADGRCQPEALLAGDAAKKRPPAMGPAMGQPSRKPQVAAVPPAGSFDAAAAPGTEGRMSLAGPAAAPQAVRPARRGRAAARAARPSSYHSAGVRSRERYRAAARPYYGFSAWPLPFPLP
jgi:hypothetical protein